MKIRHGLWMLGGAVALGGAIIGLGAGRARSEPPRPANNILAAAFALETAPAVQARLAPSDRAKLPLSVSGSVMTSVREALAAGGADTLSRDQAAPRSDTTGNDFRPPSRAGSQGCPNVFKADGRGDDEGRSGVDNVRVNQDCSLRRQAEEAVAVNPRDFNNVVAGQNDSRIGFNHCGYDWSLDRGLSWGDTGTSPPPFWQLLLQDGHTADACSDPSATFDDRGNAYITGLLFDVASPASAIYVAKSNFPIDGRFYHTPRQIPFQQYLTSPMGRPASDLDFDIFHDKALMIADSRPGSPKAGRVYVTWTRFETTATPVGGRSPIVFSQSLDGGATWSRAVIISGASGSFCTVFSGTPDNPNSCDQDQGSDPVVGPDGTIYVIFGNGNTPEIGINQAVMVKCPAANQCDKETDWLGPFRIGDLIGTYPRGDPGNAGGCPTGRECLPPNGYRLDEFTTLTISVDRNSNLYATWSDFRNGRSPCTPLSPWSTAHPPCDSDVFYAFSTTGGITWSPTIDVTPRSRLGETAQWQPWHDVMGDGSAVQVGFYDRHYGNCEFTGCNDITLATITNPRSTNPGIRYRRITTSSMPNLLPANNPVQAGFLGDYMWVEVSRHSFSQRATHIVWADTRQLFGPAPEEDVYYARVGGDGDDD